MRILIANPFGIGDVLFSLPLVQEIRSQQPESRIGVLCNHRTDELISMWPEVDWHHPFELRAAWRRSTLSGLNEFQILFESIRSQKFDLLLDFSLGWQVGFVAMVSGIPRRIGFDYRNRGRFLTERIPIAGFHRKPVAEEYLDLLPKIGLAKPARTGIQLRLSPRIEAETARYLQSLNIPEAAPLLGIVPGGGASWGTNALYKQWAPERFAEAADRLALEHGLKPLLLGDAAEEGLLQSIRQRMRSESSAVAPVPSLLLLAGLLRRCRMVLGNDSGPLHLACAVGTPTLSIFGPVDASVYGPYPIPEQAARHRVAVSSLACRPCYQDFRFPPCPWNRACLDHLTTETVVNSANRLLKEV